MLWDGISDVDDSDREIDDVVREPARHPQREIFIDNLLVLVHWIIEMTLVERPCAMGV